MMDDINGSSLYDMAYWGTVAGTLGAGGYCAWHPSNPRCRHAGPATVVAGTMVSAPFVKETVVDTYNEAKKQVRGKVPVLIIGAIAVGSLVYYGMNQK